MPRRRKVPIADSYEYRLRQRSGWGADQLPAAAMSGDRDAIAECAAMSATLAVKYINDPRFLELREWLAYALAQIGQGVEPNQAFSWTRDGGGRPPEFETLQKQYVVGLWVERLMADEALSIGEAAARVAPKFNISAEHAADHYKQLRDRTRDKP